MSHCVIVKLSTRLPAFRITCSLRWRAPLRYSVSSLEYLLPLALRVLMVRSGKFGITSLGNCSGTVNISSERRQRVKGPKFAFLLLCHSEKQSDEESLLQKPQIPRSDDNLLVET